MTTTPRDRTAWAAGVFECSGSVIATDGRIRLQLKKVDRELLERLAVVLGGRIYGPYRTGTPRADGSPRLEAWTWTSDGCDVLALVEMMRPWLGSKRLAQLAAAREKVGA